MEDVITAFENNDADSEINLNPPLVSPADAPVATVPNDAVEDLEDGEVDEMNQPEKDDVRQGENAVETTEGAVNVVPQNNAPVRPPDQTAPSQQSSLPGMPAAVTVGVDNEALKNLMMSWYYAGYYTGFYEGQHAAADTAAA